MTPPVEAESHLPRVLAVSATPMAGDWATSALMRDLFHPWLTTAPAALATITSRRVIIGDGSGPEADAQTNTEADAIIGAADVEELTVDVAGMRSPIALQGVIRDSLTFARRFAPDVVWLRSAGWPVGLEVAGAAIAARLRVPVVVQVMDDWPALMHARRPRLARVVLPGFAKMIGRAAAVAVISESMAAEYRTRYRVDPVVVHGGADLPAWEVIPPRVDAPPTEPFTIRYSGGVASHQSASAIADVGAAVAILNGSGSSVRLELSVPADSVGAARSRFGSDPSIVVEPFSDPAEHRRKLRAADALVLANNFDPASVSLLRHSMANKVGEYLASGTPMLAYGPPAIATIEAAVSGGWAEVVGTQSPEALARGLSTVLTDASRRADLAVHAAVTLNRDFDLQVHRDRFVEMIRNAARSR